VTEKNNNEKMLQAVSNRLDEVRLDRDIEFLVNQLEDIKVRLETVEDDVQDMKGPFLKQL